MIGISKKSGGRKKGTRLSYDSGLSELQKIILSWVLEMESTMKLIIKGGDTETEIELLNNGIPWIPNLFLKDQEKWLKEINPNGVLPSTLSRALHRLEDRELIAARAEGYGRNRRITHLKFSAPARRIAEKAMLDRAENGYLYLVRTFGEQESHRLLEAGFEASQEAEDKLIKEIKKIHR
jgi:DNA-binding transcriptional ArsR family regulator